MECRYDWLGDAQSADELLDALAHLSCSLVRESHGQDGLWHHTQVLDQMSNPIGNNARLTAPRARENQQRAVGGFHGFTLLRVKLVEKRQCGSGSEVTNSILQGMD